MKGTRRKEGKVWTVSRNTISELCLARRAPYLNSIRVALVLKALAEAESDVTHVLTRTQKTEIALGHLGPGLSAPTRHLRGSRDAVESAKRRRERA